MSPVGHQSLTIILYSNRYIGWDLGIVRLIVGLFLMTIIERKRMTTTKKKKTISAAIELCNVSRRTFGR